MSRTQNAQMEAGKTPNEYLETLNTDPEHKQETGFKIAKIKNISYEKVAEITTQNARSLFKI